MDYIDSDKLDKILSKLTESQLQSNKEMQDQELEALSMTLTNQELVFLNKGQQRLVSLTIIPQELEQPIKFLSKQGSIEITKLPNIKLEIQLIQAYPSHLPPIYKIKGFYEKYEEQIRQQLDSKWMNDQLVLYEWYSYCQTDLLIDLTQNHNNFLLSNIEYQQLNEEQYESLKFELDTQQLTCGICYQSYQGQDKFIILMGCLHYFCKDCICQYCENLITSGQIDKLLCPHQSNHRCKTLLNENNYKQMGLNEELIEKVFVYSINQAINRMDDFGWCPILECGQPAEIDKIKNFGTCTHCRFMFCLTCKEKYHFFKRCPALYVGYDSYNGQFKNETEKHIKTVQALMNEYYISQCTKKCPSCQFVIQKIDGCNKMTCSNCGKFFCWNCLQVITGYDHFSDSPICGDILLAEIPKQLQDEFDEKEEEVKFVELALRDSAHCPKCREINVKLGQINLIQCIKCQSYMCFMCGREAQDKENHFNMTNCYFQDAENQVQPKKQSPKR